MNKENKYNNLKVFILYDKNTKSTYYFTSLEKFCERFSHITLRLLRYTHPKQKERIKNGENVRYQEYTKNFKIVEETIWKCRKADETNIKHAKYIEDLGDWYISEETEEVLNFVNKNEKQTETKENINNADRNYEDVNIEKMIKELKSLKKKLQNARDENTLLRKLERESVRKEKELEDIKRHIYRKIEEISPYEQKVNSSDLTSTNKNKYKGVLVWSDWHIGKVAQVGNNYYNIIRARYRLKTLYKQLEKEIRKNNLEELDICMLGDFIHAQYREDMKFTAEFVEIEAGLLCFDLMKSFIDMLLVTYPNLIINITGVVGNESRLASAIPHTNIHEMAKNSIDYMIYNMLESYYRQTSRVKMKYIGTFEAIVDLDENYKLLLIHGDKINHSKLFDETTKLKTRIRDTYNIKINYVLMGHIHSTLITDFYARNASLVGADEYAVNGLNITESAISQLFGLYDCEENELRMYSLRIRDEQQNDL